MAQHKCSILVAGAVAGYVREVGYESVKRVEENFVSISGTNLAIGWDASGYCEVLTNYNRDKSWQPLRNPVCGKVHECVDAAIKRHKYWQNKGGQVI